MKIKLETNNNIQLEYQWLIASYKGETIGKSVLNLIISYCSISKPDMDQHNGDLLLGLTELKNKVMYRAHSCYKNEKNLKWLGSCGMNKPKFQEKSLNNHDNSPELVEVFDYNDVKQNCYKKNMLILAKVLCIVQEKDKNVYVIIHCSCLQNR